MHSYKVLGSREVHVAATVVKSTRSITGAVLYIATITPGFEVKYTGRLLLGCRFAMATTRAMALTLAMAALSLFLVSTTATAQVDCSAEFTAMTPCTDFVTNNTLMAPSKSCCAAFKATQTNSPVCLCQLQQAFADPATAPGNATRANAIPDLCAVAVDKSRCPALLGLAPAVAPVVAPVKAPAVAPIVAPVVAPVVAPGVAPGPKGADFDCSEQFNSLAICIAYISSNDTVPPAECCAALLTVHLKTPVCLCQLLQQVNTDPSAASGLNVTKAEDLPKVCKTGTDEGRCPALLGVPLASPLGEPPMVEAPGPDSAPVPEAGAPGIIALPPASPDTTPAVTTPTVDDANLAAIPIAILAGSILLSLWLPYF